MPWGGAHAGAPAVGSGWAAGLAPSPSAAPARPTAEHAAGHAQGKAAGAAAPGSGASGATCAAAERASGDVRGTAAGAAMQRARSADLVGAAAALQQRRAAKRPATPGAGLGAAAHEASVSLRGCQGAFFDCLRARWVMRGVSAVVALEQVLENACSGAVLPVLLLISASQLSFLNSRV